MLKQKKVVFISSHAQSLVDFKGTLIKKLVDDGFLVYALAPNHNENTRDRLADFGAIPVDIFFDRAGLNPVNDLFSFFDICIKLNKINADVVLSYFVKPVIFGTLAAWLMRVPKRIAMIEGLGFVFTYPTKELSSKGRFLKRIVSMMYRMSLKLASRVVFLNVDDKVEFLDLGLVDDRKSICIGGIGIDLNKWHPVPIFFEPVRFLMVARLLREKGICEYADAAKYVKLKYPEAQFILLGGLDENPGSIQLRQVATWHDQRVLTWHGHVPVAEHMKNASVFVLPSYREGVPVSTMEAMAMGRPVITTDVPGCRETVVDGVNGFMVPAKDSAALAEKMIWFIENPSSIAIMGAASRKMAEQKFDVHVINAKLIKIMLGDEGQYETTV